MRYSLKLTSGGFLGAGVRLIALAAVMTLAPVAAAQAASPAEAFVQSNIDHGLTILNNPGTPKEQKSTQFRNFLMGLTDLKRIADYTLGPVKNTVSTGDLAAFEDAFRDYAFSVYEAEFSKYSGQTLRVTGSVPHGANDWLVTTQLIDPHSSSDPIAVDFRVFNKDGHFSVGDITVLGMDLAITEQDDFTSFLSQHNNDVKALTANLRQRASRVRASGSISGK